MKALIVIVALGLGVSCANAQKMKETDVPAHVKATAFKEYPNIKVEKWEKEGGNYEAEFNVNKVETSVLIDAGGNLIETEVEINVSALPKGVSEYVSKNLAGQKIKEASKISDTKGTITYEAEINKVDYIFDVNGSFIKKVVEK